MPTFPPLTVFWPTFLCCGNRKPKQTISLQILPIPDFLSSSTFLMTTHFLCDFPLSYDFPQKKNFPANLNFRQKTSLAALCNWTALNLPELACTYLPERFYSSVSDETLSSISNWKAFLITRKINVFGTFPQLYLLKESFSSTN